MFTLEGNKDKLLLRFRVLDVRIFDPDFADLLMSSRFVGIFKDQQLLMIGS